MKNLQRWLNYSNSGRIPGTRFVVHKTPLETGNRVLPPGKSFTPSDLLQEHLNIKLVIDLTFTTKYYYKVQEFESRGVQYVKIKCCGHKIPEEKIYKRFVAVVERFKECTPNDYLIGVHCTHGINRTGYLIIRYMMEKLGYSFDKALEEFCIHRGHKVERTNYLEDLRRRYIKQSENTTGNLKIVL